jgi:hypothetical protein
VWFTPTIDRVDLEDARQLVSGAQRAILFLMFSPGPETLLNTITPVTLSSPGCGSHVVSSC